MDRSKDGGGGPADPGLDDTAPDDPGRRLEALRSEISALDRELIGLIGRRRELALAIGTVKRELDLPTMDPAREARVIRAAAETARELGVDVEMARDVIWRIMAAAREAQDDRARNPSPLEGPDPEV